MCMSPAVNQSYQCNAFLTPMSKHGSQFKQPSLWIHHTLPKGDRWSVHPAKLHQCRDPGSDHVILGRFSQNSKIKKRRLAIDNCNYNELFATDVHIRLH